MSEPTFTIVKNCNDQIRIRIHHTTIIGVSHRISFLTPGTYTGDQLVAEYNRVVSRSRWLNVGNSNDNITDITSALKTKVYPDDYDTWDNPALGFNVLTWDKENRLLKFHSSTTNTGAPDQHDFYFEYCPTSFTHCQFFNNVIPINTSPTAVNVNLCKTDRVYYDYTHTELRFVNIGTGTQTYKINGNVLCTLGPGEYSEQSVEDILLNYNGVEPNKTITCETVREGPYLVNYFTFTGFDTRYTVSNKDNIRLSAFYETPDDKSGWDQIADGFLIKSGSIIKHVRKIAPELTNDYAIETLNGTRYVSEHYFFRSPVVRNCFRPFYRDICPVLSSSNNTTDYIVNLPDEQSIFKINFYTKGNTKTDTANGHTLATIYIANNDQIVQYWIPHKTSFYNGFGGAASIRQTYFPLENILIPDSYLCAEYSSLGKIYFKIDKKYTNLPYEYIIEQTQKENAIYTKVNDTLQVHTRYSSQNYENPYLSLNVHQFDDFRWVYKINNPKHLMFVDTPPLKKTLQYTCATFLNTTLTIFYDLITYVLLLIIPQILNRQ